MASFHVFAPCTGSDVDHIAVNRIGVSDVIDALRLGIDDFWAKPSHYFFLSLIYPVVGGVLIVWTSGGNALQLVFPLFSGFALIGPIAAIGLYEISRRRERGIGTSWMHVFDVMKSPALPSIGALAIMLLGLFSVWMLSAQALFTEIYGDVRPASLSSFIGEVLTTQSGWMLIVVGNLTGLMFALIALSTTVVAFPLLLDRDVGAYTAVETSVRATLNDPIPILFWGLIVAVGLFIGALTLLVGLAIVLPVLGHSTWHIYRKVVEPDASA
jgi:uncharacterized membrane protein